MGSRRRCTRRSTAACSLRFTLQGLRALAPSTPIAHLSYYEADALARYLGGRLPTETEWEVAAARAPVAGNFRGRRAPACPAPVAPARALGASRALRRRLGVDGALGYDPYPGYHAPPAGALGEYNGKFMVSQKGAARRLVLHAAPPHARLVPQMTSWHPATRFQMTGVRLARDLSDAMGAAETAVGADVRAGLLATPKRLPPYLFYDDAGSRLYEDITRLPEYYLTRTERAILEAHADAIVRRAARRPGAAADPGARRGERYEDRAAPARGAASSRASASASPSTSRAPRSRRRRSGSRARPGRGPGRAGRDAALRGVPAPVARAGAEIWCSSSAAPSATSRTTRPSPSSAACAARWVRARRYSSARTFQEGPGDPPPRLRRQRGRDRRVQQEPPGAPEPRARGRLRPGPLPPRGALERARVARRDAPRERWGARP